MAGSFNENRLCSKCGMKLSSINNFCMHCGYDNDSVYGNNNGVVVNNTNITNNNSNNYSGNTFNNSTNNYGNNTFNNNINAPVNNIVVRDSLPLKSKLIYVFILLDIILISFILIIKGNGLFYEKFKYNLDNYDKVINLDNNSFLVLKNNKLRLVGENTYIDKDTIKSLSKEKVLAIEESYPSSSKVLIEVEGKIYVLQKNYGSTKEYNIKNTTGNIIDDIKKDDTNSSSDYDYQFMVESLYSTYNYYIENGALYKYERDYNKLNKYNSKLVMDKNTLGMNNPEIIYIDYEENVIIKDNSKIKMFTEGELKQSIEKIAYRDKVYNISDFKYILFNNEKFLFVTKTGKTINYTYTFNKYRKNKNESNIVINNSDSNSNIISKYIINFYKKYIIYYLISISILIGVIYYFRESSFLNLTFKITGCFYILYLISLLYFNSKHISIFDNIKTSIKMIQLEFIIAIYVTQIKEISSYIVKKLNIETIYHFILMLIAVTCLTISVGLLTGNSYFIVLLIGIIWAYLVCNNEEYVEEEIDDNTLIKIIGFIVGSFILCLVICSLFSIPNYYLFIMVSAFSIAYFTVCNFGLTIKAYLSRFLVSIIGLVLMLGYFIISILRLAIDTYSKLDSSGDYISKYIKNEFLSLAIGALLIGLLGLLGSVLLYGFNNILKNIIGKINNRVLKTVVVMLYVIIVVSLLVILLPYVSDLNSNIYNSITK